MWLSPPVQTKSPGFIFSSWAIIQVKRLYDAILKGTTFTKYKQFVQNCFKICPRQALHAKSLGFEHPTTKKEVFFDSDLADDMQELIEKWRKYATHQKL